MTPEGRRLRRTLLWVAALFVGLNLVIWVATRFSAGGSVTGPSGSSYVTTRSGSAALEGALRRLGESTVRSRRPLDETPLPPDATLVAIDVGGADYSATELNAVESFVTQGGRLVVAGQATMMERLLADAPSWAPEGRDRAEVVGDVLGSATGRSVPLSGFGSLEVNGDDAPFLAAGDGTVIGAYRSVGDGRVLWLADSHPLHNEGLGGQSAAVSVMAMIDPVGPVVFDEYRHGYTDEGGVWAVIPPRGRLTLILLGVTALMALIGYGRRFGPPYDTQRRLPPGREAYLEAVAGIMARSGDRSEALSVIREEARRILQERSGDLPAEEAARSAGLDTAQIRALLDGDDSDETLVEADKGLATLIREER